MYFLVDAIYECRRLPMEQLFRTNGKLVYFVFKESFDRKYYV